MIKCVIFDLDGLMVNTEIIAREVYKTEAKKLGFDLDDDFFIGITGSSIEASKPYFDKYPGLMDHAFNIFKIRKETILKACSNKKNLNKKGLTCLLDYLFENNYKVCIATSSFLDYVIPILNNLGKKYPFDAIITGDMVKKHKPDPEIFLLAAETVNIHPEECLVLEDSKNGLIAAKKANMLAGFIYDTILVENHYDFKFNNLNEVITLLKNR